MWLNYWIDSPLPSKQEEVQTPKPVIMNEAKRRKNVDENESYFSCYADIGIHAEMLADRVRTKTYKWAILKNYESVYGKVVLDVGCGTGILSMFCVMAGAKKVYAVEASDIATEAIKVIHSNNMQDKITVIHAKIEEAEIPEKVDVIVSEWMGYMLLYECMLQSVLYARNKWLQPNGVMFPSRASLYLTVAADREEEYNNGQFWDDVGEEYKVNLTTLKDFSAQSRAQKVQITTVCPEEVLAHSVNLLNLNLRDVNSESLQNIQCPFSLSCFGHSQVQCFVMWFDVHFLSEIQLSTSPDKDPTHWQQAVFYLTKPLDVEQDTIISGHVVIQPNKAHTRCLDVEISYSKDGNNKEIQKFVMDGIIT